MSEKFLFQAIHFSRSIFFVYTWLNVKTVLLQAIQFNIQKTVPFQIIQFSISTQFKCENNSISRNLV